ncbi:hypothetical protein SFD76_001601 [Salmonella enterica]|nr:DUF6056 family protein [Salmonella enterica]EBG0218266.1 hypothetical protein [Salmonella enterica subsp. enterica serovar Nima]ECI3927189.1 hypothetical protein [Salmonella enterica subsp. enterica serovar Brandenburg]EDL5731115.1 hypothetical protein [Salmonella enterica subsp. enterica serovar Halle]EDX4384337.1 hypothetical protein [Salmonella enterica subsp. enterica serovar O rough]EAV3219142.1 hypothetical protein [Salmonella enterica]
MKHQISNKYIYFSVCVIFFSVIYVLNYYTPLQSDDYGYAILGYNLEAHLHHYLTWSGRIVADFISPTLLLINNKFLIAAIQTLGVLLVLLLISKFDNKAKRLYILSVISIVFFLSHPSFGQSNLWIVGSANYLWTSVLYVFVAKEVIGYVQNKKINPIAYPVSLLAGCTNENASLTLVGIIILSVLYLLIKTKKIDFKLLSILFLTIIGAIFLLATPGNESRMMDPSFAQWRSLSLIEKIDLHIFHRVPDVFKSSKLAYIIAIALIVLCLRIEKSKPITKDGGPTDLLISAVLLFASIGCSLVMVFSPAFPDRAKTPSFIFCIMSIAYSLNFLRYEILNNYIIKTLYFIISITFIAESISVISSYHSINLQNSMRIKLIAKSNNEKETLIPEFYFKPMPSSTYKFDTWTNFDAMSKYYNKKNIVAYGTIFDYSVIDDNNYKIHDSSDMQTKNGLKGIYIYSEKYLLNTVFLFELTHQERLSVQPNQRFFFHVTDITGNYHNFDFDPNYTYVNDRVFLYAKLDNIPLWYIKSVSFGSFDSTSPAKRYSQLHFTL